MPGNGSFKLPVHKGYMVVVVVVQHCCLMGQGGDHSLQRGARVSIGGMMHSSLPLCWLRSKACDHGRANGRASGGGCGVGQNGPACRGWGSVMVTS